MWLLNRTSQPSARSTSVVKVSPLASGGNRYAGSDNNTGGLSVTSVPSSALGQQAQKTQKKLKSWSGPLAMAGEGGGRNLITSNDPILWETSVLLEYIDACLPTGTWRIRDFVREHRLTGLCIISLEKDDAQFLAGGDETLTQDVALIAQHLRTRIAVRAVEPRYPRATDVFPEFTSTRTPHTPSRSTGNRDAHRRTEGTTRPTGVTPSDSEWCFDTEVDDIPPSTPFLSTAEAAGLTMLGDTVGYIPGDPGTSPISERYARFFVDDFGTTARAVSLVDGDGRERLIASLDEGDAIEGVPVVPAALLSDQLDSNHVGGIEEPGRDASINSDVRLNVRDTHVGDTWRDIGPHDEDARRVLITDVDEDTRTSLSRAVLYPEKEPLSADVGERAELGNLPIQLNTTDVDVDHTTPPESRGDHRSYEPSQGRSYLAQSPLIRSSILNSHPFTTARPRRPTLTASVTDLAAISPMLATASDWSANPGTVGTPLTSWYDGSPAIALHGEIRRTPFFKTLSLPLDGHASQRDADYTRQRHRRRPLSVSDVHDVQSAMYQERDAYDGVAHDRVSTPMTTNILQNSEMLPAARAAGPHRTPPAQRARSNTVGTWEGFVAGGVLSGSFDPSLSGVRSAYRSLMDREQPQSIADALRIITSLGE